MSRVSKSEVQAVFQRAAAVIRSADRNNDSRVSPRELEAKLASVPAAEREFVDGFHQAVVAQQSTGTPVSVYAVEDFLPQAFNELVAAYDKNGNGLSGTEIAEMPALGKAAVELAREWGASSHPEASPALVETIQEQSTRGHYYKGTGPVALRMVERLSNGERGAEGARMLEVLNTLALRVDDAKDVAELIVDALVLVYAWPAGSALPESLFDALGGIADKSEKDRGMFQLMLCDAGEGSAPGQGHIGPEAAWNWWVESKHFRPFARK